MRYSQLRRCPALLAQSVETPSFPLPRRGTRRSSSIAALLGQSINASSSSSNTSSTSASTSSSTSPTTTICGTVRSVRRQKRVAFAAIGDGSTLKPLQAVLTPAQAQDLSTGAAVKLTGQWQSSPSGKEQSHELLVSDVQLLGENDATTNPIQKKYQSPEFLRSLPHLRTRIPQNALLLHLRSQLTAQVTSFFSREGFVQTHPPLITSSDCEGAGEVFLVAPASDEKATRPETHAAEPSSEQFFRTPKYLTVSSQLHLEALAQSVGKVWTLSPAFRAEKSDTPRHLSEFYMLEAEVCYVDNLDQVMDVVEAMLRDIAFSLRTSSIVQEIMELRRGEVNLEKRWDGLATGPWPRVTYADAIALLRDAVTRGSIKFEFEPSLGSGLHAEHEKYLAEEVGQGSPVFVTHYPRAVKPFYMPPSDPAVETSTDLETVACFDLLVPETCEIVGGSLREHRSTQLLEAMKSHGLIKDTEQAMLHNWTVPEDVDAAASGDAPNSLQWYIDLRKYGSVPHGGFGLGFDRLLSYLSGTPNIRDVVAFPRWYGRCDC